MVHNTFWWKKLLALKSNAKEISKEDINFLFIENDGGIIFNKDKVNPTTVLAVSLHEKFPDFLHKADIPLFRVNENLDCDFINQFSRLSHDEISFLQLYLPYTLIPYFAKKLNKTYTISHLTQSLDGKIATCSGHSKWIGNEEDLVHTHCMRSLCDGIIIGNNTLKNDEPKLTVRNVEGPSPVKMIIGNTISNLESLLSDIEQPLISFSNKQLYRHDNRVREIVIAGDYISTADILHHLYLNGFNSLFIEGGATTVSGFLKEKAIDSFQIHIANKILGSGIPAICLDEIETIEESISLKNTKHYHLGEEILMVANMNT
jgi:diaminohydroxyphosphoribosylaminopyrimidine deaminase / 5-amino-6-(5-phosphoribosylamino)uracil reductase